MSIMYNGKNLTQLLDLVIAAKEIPSPTRKEITETVPYMSGEWDFSFLDDVDEYETLPLKYSFDIIGDTKDELYAQRKQAIKFFNSRGDQKFYDTDISDTAYYKVYRVQTGWSEEGLQGLLTVEIKCYPFMIKDISKSVTASSSEQEITVLDGDDYRPSKISLIVNGSVTVKHLEYNNSYAVAGSYGLSTGTYNEALRLKAYDKLSITGSGSVTIKAAAEAISFD